ncbi:LSU ribosomal protein L3P [Chitinophaga polysaccharea]|uniref:Large ribosomal subunit protein uL3 n=2 Tax=Chitinophaga TaxID=79328 RepID=A0A847SF03_9BACT|nr:MULTISPECIES: 50S ribosomal protein L3 [Chitinophaga]NLR60914.1 50S ribosomal protein L3 [Chitinophaga polysaccharea]NLR81780.1 50S ribosomal protein L3 [Chitinophaga eiseniae]NLU94712.1 50S ribosomal protein L3 [Chitinophaga sp. Ak27]TWF37465.1 LSU ribosomal protein L3P [Chitinophaga polysaccharea]
MKGIIGKKIGMTSIFEANGKQTAVTIIEAGPNVVTQVKTLESDGYNAIQVSFGEKKEKHTTKAESNHFAKASTSPKRYVKELRNPDVQKALGESITCEIFAEGETIDVVGTSKGKGFQGVVKRHGFSGVGEATHGQHDRSRAPGSVGGSSYPSRVFKGMRMAGQTGNERVKVKGLKIVKIFPEKNYILVSGSVPGHNGSIVLIQK